MNGPRQTQDIVTDLVLLMKVLPECKPKSILSEAIGRIKAIESAHASQVELSGRLNRKILELDGRLENPATKAEADAAARVRDP